MQSIKLYFKQLSGEQFILQFPLNFKIIDVKQQISDQKNTPITSIVLLFKTKILEDQLTIAESNLQFGDCLTLQIKRLKNQPILSKCTSNKCQDDEMQIKELIGFGFKREQIEGAVSMTKGDYLEAFILLQDKKSEENLIQEEIPPQIPSQKERYKVLLQDPIVSELRGKVSNELEWNNTINVIKEQNQNLFSLIDQNQDEFRHLYIEKHDKNAEFLYDDDIENLNTLKEFKPDLGDKYLLDIYIQNNRDMYNTVAELEK